MKSTRWVTYGGLMVILFLLAVALPIYLYYRPLGPSRALNSPAYVAEENEPSTGKQPPSQVLKHAPARLTVHKVYRYCILAQNSQGALKQYGGLLDG